ncbi:MAG: hypothetical protein IJJ64_14090 [Butyrivibrio sp.]|nr:hypothetical protein [Butyrivibrio sp.]MBQ7613672.1 hypothetical protein [Butyrivibrio sp.]
MHKVIECRGQSFCVAEKNMGCNLDMAVFIDKNRYVWGLGEDLAIAMVESYEGNIETIMIPGTDFIVIFDEANTVILAGHKYLFYDCLIMKSTEKGLKAIPADEIDAARNAFKKQTGRYQVGPFEFLAYRIS